MMRCTARETPWRARPSLPDAPATLPGACRTSPRKMTAPSSATSTCLHSGRCGGINSIAAPAPNLLVRGPVLSKLGRYLGSGQVRAAHQQQLGRYLGSAQVRAAQSAAPHSLPGAAQRAHSAPAVVPDAQRTQRSRRIQRHSHRVQPSGGEGRQPHVRTVACEVDACGAGRQGAGGLHAHKLHNKTRSDQCYAVTRMQCAPWRTIQQLVGGARVAAVLGQHIDGGGRGADLAGGVPAGQVAGKGDDMACEGLAGTITSQSACPRPRLRIVTRSALT